MDRRIRHSPTRKLGDVIFNRFRLIRPEVKKFRIESQKNIFLERSSKNVKRVLFWFFDIVSLDDSRGLWSFISGDDVISGNVQTKKFLWVFEPTEFNSFSFYLSRTCLWHMSIRWQYVSQHLHMDHLQLCLFHDKYKILHHRIWPWHLQCDLLWSHI